MKTVLTGFPPRLSGFASTAPGSGVTYDPTTSGLTAEDVQAAIDELVTLIAAGVIVVTDGVVTVNPASAITVPLGGVVDLGGANADLRFLTAMYGGQARLVTDTSVGATYDVDCSAGSVFDLTLTVNLTYTISNPPPTGVSSTIYLILRQGGTGSYTVTHPATVDWQDTDGTSGGAAPTLHTAVGAVNIIELTTLDGGITWGGADTAGTAGGTPATTVTDETTFGITPAVGTDTEYARQDHTHGSPTNPVSGAAISALGFVGQLLISDTPSTPLVFADLIQNEAQTDLVYADV